MSLCRTALRVLGRLRPPAASSARLFSSQQSLWEIGMDESLEHNYPSPWIGVVSEIMKNPLTERDDFADFYNLLSDKPLSMEEIETGRAAFASGYLGPIYKRAWLFASLEACTCLSHRAMGFSFLQYFLSKKEVRTPANYLAVLRFVAADSAYSNIKQKLVEKMKEEFDEEDLMVCSRGMRNHFTSINDWKSLLELSEMTGLSKREMSRFLDDAFYVCMETLDLHSAKEVIAKYQTYDLRFPLSVLDHAWTTFNSLGVNSVSNHKTYLRFLELAFERLCIGVGSYPNDANANLMVDFFSKLSSPKWIAVKGCKTNVKGECSNCGMQLRHFEPSRSDLKCIMEDLKEATFFKARKLYSSEGLFRSFERFLDNCGPFDIVFDVLNFIGIAKRNPRQIRHRPFRVMADLIEQYKPKSILFIGKNHSANNSLERFVKRAFPDVKLITFHIQNIYKDDAFMLYAAVSRNAYLVSNDAFRDHLALLPERSKLTFKQWLVSRQIVVTPYDVSYPEHSVPLVYGSLAKGKLHVPHSTEAASGAQALKHAFVCLKKASRGARKV